MVDVDDELVMIAAAAICHWHEPTPPLAGEKFPCDSCYEQGRVAAQAVEKSVRSNIEAAIGAYIRTPPGVTPSDATKAYMHAFSIVRWRVRNLDLNGNYKWMVKEGHVPKPRDWKED